MKSWITPLLPHDEYKEKRILFFFAEGGLLLFLSIVIMLVSSYFFTIGLRFGLFFPIAIFLLYVTARYTFAGIEYPFIASEKAYKREFRLIIVRTITFVIIFFLLYLLLVDIQQEWRDVVGLVTVVSIVTFLTNYISLKMSYKKNKELL
ncbi:hypothetical protein [Alkalihalobacterium bogoriense]|uniref:hypothetical protein n=1 Tax=Alkalihalobacterium bogoriense TaxID=246272 RepID=UPI00047C10AE|nr:hypothetical protein [Alkalihalobacterium bogoriense]